MKELGLPYQRCVLESTYILWKHASKTNLKVEKVRNNSSMYISGALWISLNEIRKFLLSCVLSGLPSDSSFTLRIQQQLANPYTTRSLVKNQQPTGIFHNCQKTWCRKIPRQWPLQSAILMQDTKVSGNVLRDSKYYD